MAADRVDSVVNLCKRRGFVFPSSEIYGGSRSAWDYGPLGVELKRNIKDFWWDWMTRRRDDIEGLDASSLMSPRVWEASGHVSGFTDPLVDCKNCKQRFRADQIPNVKVCPACGKETLTEARQFNLMFKTQAGPVEDSAATAYLRPETAQGMFTNFSNVLNTTRKKPPFGIAQVGKSFRNEITPGNFIFRTREFEQMEMEFFVVPGTDEEWHQYWIDERTRWYVDLGIKADNLRHFEHPKEKLSHYSKRTVDIEYRFNFTGSEWGELEGIANRTDFDLRQHSKFSGKDLSYFDTQTNERFIPYVIEPSAGADRSALAFLADAYTEEEVEGAVRTVLKLHPALAPVKVAVLPLSKNERLMPLAREVNDRLKHVFATEYEDTQSIGRRYRRQDEIGTPFCVTIDFESLDDNQVTIRDRDSLAQIRLPLENLAETLKTKLAGEAFGTDSLWAGARA